MGRWPHLVAGCVAAALSSGAEANGFRILKGHGGPVMAAAAAEGGDGVAATASFDNSVGVWPLSGGSPVWLEGHEAAVKTVAFVGDDRVISGGDDHIAILWDRAAGTIRARLSGHKGKIMSVAASPAGDVVATASWDGRIGLWNARSGERLRWLTGHTGNVNDVAFTSDGALYSASYDGTVREWRVADGTLTRTLARHGFGVNALLLNEAAGWLAYGALDGGTRVLRLSDGGELADLTLERRPILAMAMRPDGGQIAVGDGEGYIMVVDAPGWAITHDFRAAKRGPIWALAYVDEGRAVLAGGIEDDAYIWPLEGAADAPQMGETARAFHTDPAAVGNGERQFLRKCSVCHSLAADGGRKAGPSLYGLFGRQAGVYPGYVYSAALDGSDLIWSEATVDKLFALGPDHYTPGSKMPMQRIARDEDRADLIAYLKAATASK